MKMLFLITVLGCSDDMTICDPVSEMQIALANRQACEIEAQALVEKTPVDYPTATYECAPAGPLMADPNGGTLVAEFGPRPVVK